MPDGHYLKTMDFLQHGSFFLWKPAALLRVSGGDAEVFLQGQFTNDMRFVRPDLGVYGLWLNQKGKVLADSFVGRFEGSDFWLASYFSQADRLRRRLEEYIIADDVEISDLTTEWAGVSLLGKGAGAWLSQNQRVGLIFPGLRQSGENWEWIFPARDLDRVSSQLTGAREVETAEVMRLRVQAGIPAVPFDIGPTDLPSEGGLDATAISYTKGCYLGQEVMARLKSMGQVRRRLLSVRGEGSVPETPAKIVQDQKQVGELRTAAGDDQGFLGLAMMSLVNLKPGPARLVQANGDRPIEIGNDSS